MLNIFEGVVLRTKELMGPMSVKQFALKLGMTQQTVDLYIKGARKPSVEFIYNICCSFNVSSDWLLGLPERSGGITQQATANGPGGQAVALAHGNVVISPGRVEARDCSTCKYKRLAEVIKATL